MDTEYIPYKPMQTEKMTATLIWLYWLLYEQIKTET